MPKILLVEDVEVNRNMLRDRLTRRGFEVRTAENGEQALAACAADRPDLVLMDLGLPGIDGWEATRRLKADPATAAIPVVALSAHATAEAKDKAVAAGCADFETKPPQLDALVKKIHALLAQKPPPPTSVRETAVLPVPAARRPGETLLPFDDRPLPVPPRVTPARVAPAPPLVRPEPETHHSLPTVPSAVTPPPAVLPEPETVAVTPPAPAPADVVPVDRKRILVVEDNDPNRVMLCRRLNKQGFATTEARDGREALDAAQAQRFDLMLLDIMMPEMDGYQVLRQLKSDPDLQALPVIMISALDEMGSVVRCIEMGAEDYLTKPYDPVLLQARINACLDKRRLRDQELAYLRAVADLTQAAALVERGEFDPTLLAAVAGREDALGRLARVFDRMAREVQAREQQLRQEVERLRVIVEIDEEKKKREVQEVTEGEFFLGLEARADELRKKRERRKRGGIDAPPA